MDTQEKFHYITNQEEYITMFMSMHENDYELLMLTSMALALGIILGKVI